LRCPGTAPSAGAGQLFQDVRPSRQHCAHSASTPADRPPAAWYDDPLGEGLRYWDGRTWTEHVARAATAAAAQSQPGALGYLYDHDSVWREPVSAVHAL